MLIAGCLKEYAAVFFSLILHELSHIAAARLRGIKPECIAVTPVGFTAVINDNGCSGRILLGIYFAGPLSNLILYCLLSAAGHMFPAMAAYIRMASSANLLLALFNLVPAFPLDGGKILMELLSGSMGILGAGRLIRRIAWFISSAMLLAGIYQLYITSYNVSLIIVGLYIQLTLRNAGMESALMNIRQILYRRTKLLKKGIYPARDLVVTKSAKLGDTLKSMDFDRYHIIHMLDDELRLSRSFTESEIMDALSEDGENMSFGQLADKLPEEY